MNKSVGSAVRKLRQARGLSLDHLAARSGLSRDQIQTLETGTRGDEWLEKLAKVAQPLATTVSSLLGIGDNAGSAGGKG